ncbi:MAG: ATP-dependent RecD-like DNA helicase [Myxococcales bacterium]|nr:ATP-dependent RecD-like DNA helicase [Myxococcales bacterium]
MATTTPKPSIEGTLDRIVFQNAENAFTVAKLSLENGEEVTVVGPLVGLQKGAPLYIEGSWVDDKRFGRQFKVESFQVRSPQTLLGIERYLSSGIIPGIGDELAKRIVGEFGMRTFEIIGSSPGALTAVEGIGPSRTKKIAEAWKDQKQIQDVMVFLRGHGVSAAFAARIYKHYGADSIEVVQSNPYRLALDIWGIGFKSADAIAQNLGIAKDAGERIEAGLLHVLGQLSEDGHVVVPQQHAIDAGESLLGVHAALIGPAISRLLVSRLLVREELDPYGVCLSLTNLHGFEVESAEFFVEIATTQACAIDIKLEKFLYHYEKENEITLAPQQREAIEAGVEDKCIVITGGPGVGKTTIIRALVDIYDLAGLEIALAAPTGRAAKRLAESTGRPASTLHRLLEFQPQTGGFERGLGNQLEADVVIVDEASMVDIALFRGLVASLPHEATFIVVGDVDQLPSVGPGSVLADLIESGVPTVVKLTEIFRQAAKSQIVVSAHQINAGQLPSLAPPPGDDPGRSDFYFIERENPIAARDTVIELISDRIPKRFGYDPLTDVQVLTPMHRGELGTTALNAAMQECIGGKAGNPEIKRGTRCYRVGDKVMQIRNNYDKEVFNGDVGIVRVVEPKASILKVELLGGRMVLFQRNELDDLMHAFAISVHKSQGSEYPCVVLPLLTQHYMMLQRNLLYTALTRGKELVVMVGSSRAVKMAVGNQSSKERWTHLAERIRDRVAPN